MFWTYILQNPTGKFYIGHTDDLQTRVANHNRTDKTRGKFTRKNGPWVLVWFEGQSSRSSAMRRERQNRGNRRGGFGLSFLTRPSMGESRRSRD